MEIHIIKDYKEKYPKLKAKKLTEALIRECTDCPNLVISRTKTGKPYAEGISFSVSHSKDLFACIISENNIGIDIQHKRTVKAVEIAERYFTEKEISRLINLDNYGNEKPDADEFFRIWTRKEAFCKYTGEGIAQVMDKVDVIERTDVTFQDCTIVDLKSGETCFCAICMPAETKEKIPNVLYLRRENEYIV